MTGKLSRLICLVLLTGFTILEGLGQDSLARQDLFASDSILNLEIRLNMDSLLNDAGDDPNYQQASIRYTDTEHESPVEMDIEIRVRGSFRKKPENCDFPPFKLKFSRQERQGSIFEGIRELKMVTHCQSDIEVFEQYVIQEYLLYRGYNLLTDYSLRVRLARISWVDISTRFDTLTRLAILIEDEDDMARRNGGEILELESAPSDKLDKYHTTLMALYNYMVLNTDYSIPILHNIELVSLDHFEPPIPVPYDFDWSGLINIPYDSPFVGSKSKFDGREYKGPCVRRKHLDLVIGDIKHHRREFILLYHNFPYLDPEIRWRSIQEINMFFILINNRNLVRQEFVKNCLD